MAAGAWTMMSGGAALASTGAGRLAEHASSDDAVEPWETNHVEESRRPNEKHPGRDKGGRYTTEGNSAARDNAAGKEQQGLSQYEDKFGVKPVTDQVVARVNGSDVGRKYKGLVQKPDGTYEGIEVKSGKSAYNGQQKDFDSKVSPENPAYATLHGKLIKITSVYLEKVQ